MTATAKRILGFFFFHIKGYYVIRKDTVKCNNMETHSLLLLLGIVNKGFSFERGPRGDGNSLEFCSRALLLFYSFRDLKTGKAIVNICLNDIKVYKEK